MGIAVKTFLDDKVGTPNTAEEWHDKVKTFAASYIPQATHFEEDLETAFDFFNAITAAVKVLGQKVVEPDVWEDAKRYLDGKRGRTLMSNGNARDR
jgi:hypothetical protein